MYIFIYLFWPTACRMSVPPPGIKPRPYAMEVYGHNHWTNREFPSDSVFQMQNFKKKNLNVPLCVHFYQIGLNPWVSL